jgi:hypothetical protein
VKFYFLCTPADFFFPEVFVGVIPKKQHNFMITQFSNFCVSVIFPVENNIRVWRFFAISTKINGNDVHNLKTLLK